MPRKGRDKSSQSPKLRKKATAGAEAMPQVWLPDQPATDGDDGFPVLPPNEEGPPPTDEEQRQMAQFWAKEDHQAPRGWDEDQELDYSEVVRRREEREERERSEPREMTTEVETPDLFKYAQSTAYSVRYLGTLTKLPSPSSGSHDPPTTTLAMIDRAQKQGLLPWVTSDANQRVFCISKYGIKVTDPQKQRVYSRHSLHHIVDITHYIDTYGKHMLAVRVAGANEPDHRELFIYEAEDETQAGDMCVTLDQAFKTVHCNLLLQQNLTSDPSR